MNKCFFLNIIYQDLPGFHGYFYLLLTAKLAAKLAGGAYRVKRVLARC